ncbi:glycoside hydrolase family 2 protein [Cohnella hashimotonis]|uniref:beta-mannosidase n=1 Tax=Cohnella hashimotonis TaxID=2826895 RepID=A0ABT6TAX5_9BACL|nr:glycoside hydrolase family 2 TIM barrel-domain containing protein [Cohnella hashimotonis]MDI4643919.1 glycoside hydrolase family 2 TIM barrel-domain containing protein [Cohnella hashimotonis]
MKEWLLNGETWEVKGYWPWVPLKVSSMEIGQELLGVTDWMPATVPGGVHADLLRAGLIEDPWSGLNSWKCEWVENRWWVYRATFACPEPGSGRTELVFKGLDYEAQVFVDGKLLGEHEGMYHEVVFDVTEAARTQERMEVTVMFKHAPDEMSQIGLTSRTYTQKSRFNYKWDFSTRLVNIGIWDDVLLRVHEAWTLDDVSVTTDADPEAGTGEIFVSAAARGFAIADDAGAIGNGAEVIAGDAQALTLRVDVTDPDGVNVAHSESPIGTDGRTGELRIPIEQARLWQPNGYGEQPLYGVRLTLLAGGDVMDTRELKTGIRSLSYAQNEESPAEALPYTFVVNGKRIYVRGVNMTPLDHLYGNVTPEQYEYYVLLMKRAGVNMVRVWGGGIIEKESFYDLCDRHGLLVWQEFVQSSSGIDNIPSKRPAFLELIALTAVSALKAKRNHVSLTVWSGGNELMSEPNVPSTYEDANLAMLKKLVETHDPRRLFLPTSASGPVQYITPEKGISHDVHGHWKYQGNPGHYELYSDVDNLFHSEFGVDGVSAVKSLKKFLPASELRPVSMNDSLVWRHHGEWWDTYDRDIELFGEDVGAGIGLFSRASQWIQAEGLRFVLEANRRRQFKNSGSVIWQLNEPYPNASSTSLVDYYGESKMAYYWTRRAYSPYFASAAYKRLNFRSGETFEARLFAGAHAETEGLTVRSRLLGMDGELLHEQSDAVSVDGEHTAHAGDLHTLVTEAFGSLFLLRLELLDPAGAVLHANDYFFSTLERDVYAPALTSGDGGRLTATALGDWAAEDTTAAGETIAAQGDDAKANDAKANDARANDVLRRLEAVTRRFRLTNDGDHAALHVHAEESTNGWWMAADDLYFTLLPGESRELTVTCWRKRAGGFLAGDVGAAADALPELGFRSF